MEVLVGLNMAKRERMVYVREHRRGTSWVRGHLRRQKTAAGRRRDVKPFREPLYVDIHSERGESRVNVYDADDKKVCGWRNEELDEAINTSGDLDSRTIHRHGMEAAALDYTYERYGGLIKKK